MHLQCRSIPDPLTGIASRILMLTIILILTVHKLVITGVGFSRDAAGNYTTIAKVCGRIQVNERGDETRSRSQVEILDLDRNVVNIDSTTGQAKRIRVELPN
jgi:hypothetical protein